MRVHIVACSADQEFGEQLESALKNHTPLQPILVSYPTRMWPFETEIDACLVVVLSSDALDANDQYHLIVTSRVFLDHNIIYISINELKFERIPGFKNISSIIRSSSADVIATAGAVARHFRSTAKVASERRPTPPQLTPARLLLDEAPHQVENAHAKEAIIKTALESLVDGKTNAIAICGANGLGKTVAMRMLAEECKQHYTYLAWFSLKTIRSLAHLLTELGRLPELRSALEALNQAAPPRQLAGLLEATSTLIIFDNLESILETATGASIEQDALQREYIELFELLRTHRCKGSLAITSVVMPPLFVRGALAEDRLVAYDMPPLRDAECVELAKSQSAIATSEQARRINEIVGGNFSAWLELVRHSKVAQVTLAELSGDRELLQRSLPERVSNYIETQASPEDLAVLFAMAVANTPLRPTDILHHLKHLSNPMQIQKSFTRLEASPMIEFHHNRTWQLQSWVKDGALRQLRSALCREISQLDGSIEHKWLRTIRLVNPSAAEYVQDEQRAFISAALVRDLISIVGTPRVLGEHILRLFKHYNARPGSGYAIANLFDIAKSCSTNLSGLDLSNTVCDKVDFRDRDLRDVRLIGCRFEDCVFSDSFGPITAVHMHSGAGKLVVAGTFSGRIRLWTMDGKKGRSFVCGTDWISKIIPDRQSSGGLFCASLDGSIHKIDLDTGANVRIARFPGRKVRNLVQSSSGRLWAISDDGSIKILEHTGEVIKEIALPHGRMLAATTLQLDDDELLLFGGDEPNISILSDTTLDFKGIIDTHGRPVRALVTDEQDRIFIAHRTHLSVASAVGRNWSIDNTVELPSRLWSLAYDRRRKQLLTGSNDAMIRVWDAELKTPVSNLPGHSSWVRCLSVDSDAGIAVSGSEDQSVRVWDLSTYRNMAVVKGYSNRLFAASMDSNGNIYTGGGVQKILALMKPRGRQKKRRIEELDGHADQVFAISHSPVNHLLATGSDDGTVIVWDLRSGKRVRSNQLHSGWVGAMAFSPDGEFLATGGDDRKIVIQGMSDGTRFDLLAAHPGRVSGVKALNTSELVTMGETGTFSIINLQKRAATKSITTGFSLLYSMDVVSTNPLIIVFGDSRGVLRSLNFDTGDIAHILTVRDHAPIWTVAFAPQRAEIAIGTDDGAIIVGPLHDLVKQTRVAAHKKQVWSVSWSQDETTLLSAGEDGTVALWREPWDAPIERIAAPRIYEGMTLEDPEGLADVELDILRELGASA